MLILSREPFDVSTTKLVDFVKQILSKFSYNLDFFSLHYHLIFFIIIIFLISDSKCYFVGNLAVLPVLVVKLPLTTSAEVPGSNPGHG